MKKHRHGPVAVLITKLNPFLRGWAEHYKAVTSKKVFSSLGHYTWQSVWRLLKARHPRRPRRVLRQKYFKSREGNNWVLFSHTEQGREITLFQIGWVTIQRHVLCKSLNPFLPENQMYFARRTARVGKTSQQLSSQEKILSQRQQGRCPVCDLPLLNADSRQPTPLETHHALAKRDGGGYDLANLRLLHKTCHLQITHSKNSALRAAWIATGIICENRPTEMDNFRPT